MNYNARSNLVSYCLEFVLGLSPPPTTRPDVAGSDAVQDDRPKPKQPVSSLNRRSRPKDDYTYDSRKSSSEDERVSKSFIKISKLVGFLLNFEIFFLRETMIAYFRKAQKPFNSTKASSHHNISNVETTLSNVSVVLNSRNELFVHVKIVHFVT